MIQPYFTKPCVISTVQNTKIEYAISEKQNYRNIQQHIKIKYLNNIIKQNYRHIKRITSNNVNLMNFDSTSNTIQGIEAVHMITKKQTLVRNVVDELN